MNDTPGPCPICGGRGLSDPNAGSNYCPDKKCVMEPQYPVVWEALSALRADARLGMMVRKIESFQGAVELKKLWGDADDRLRGKYIAMSHVNRFFNDRAYATLEQALEKAGITE